MKVTVKLYGTLSEEVTGYDHDRGLQLDLPDDASIGDVLSGLGIARSKHPVAAIDGRIRKNDDRIIDGAQVHVFQPLHGG